MTLTGLLRRIRSVNHLNGSTGIGGRLFVKALLIFLPEDRVTFLRAGSYFDISISRHTQTQYDVDNKRLF